MFTVKRVIDGDRISTEHKKVRVGDRKSRVFREALKLLENERFDIVTDEGMLAILPGLKRLAPDVVDPNTQIPSDILSFETRFAVSAPAGFEYLRAIFPNIVLPDATTGRGLCFYKDIDSFVRAIAEDMSEFAILVLPVTVDIATVNRQLRGYTPLEKLLNLKPSPDSDLHIVIYTRGELQQVELEPGPTMEFCDVQEQSQWVNGESVVTVLKGARPGDRSVDELIGVMCIEEESGYDADNQISSGALYELFYKGDEVYVVNSHGKTTDVLK
ncbi:TPA: hypothetical protein ACTPQ1_004786 [Salmonella enterica]